MAVFYSDLDNTLIYSYKRELGAEKRCVELYQGREISFMTEESFRLLKQVRQKVMFVPTTTRTKEQYGRIDFGQEEPEYALVCNGGILLHHGNVATDWYRDSLLLIEHGRPELEKAVELLKTDENRSFEIRFPNELFVFTKSEAPNQTAAVLKEALDREKVDIFSNGTKVYVVPVQLNKGKAAARLQEMTGADEMIAAGDSLFDLPMLQEADLAFCPEELMEKWGSNLPHAVVQKNVVFSDGILEYILRNYG